MQGLLIIRSLVYLQVIYKKFQVKCPFEDFAHNRTVLGFNTSVTADPGGVQMIPEGDPACTPRLFNINSQVYHSVTEIMLRHSYESCDFKIKWKIKMTNTVILISLCIYLGLIQTGV